MRQRLVMIPFENRQKRKDTKLPEKLRDEWPGILRWMINGRLAPRLAARRPRHSRGG